MKYDVKSSISPAVLASIASFRFFLFVSANNVAAYFVNSEEDYDVFGLRQQYSDNGNQFCSTYFRGATN